MTTDAIETIRREFDRLSDGMYMPDLRIDIDGKSPPKIIAQACVKQAGYKIQIERVEGVELHEVMGELRSRLRRGEEIEATRQRLQVSATVVAIEPPASPDEMPF